MGADSLLWVFGCWHRAAEIHLVAPLIVASRPGQPLNQFQTTLPPGLVLEPVEEQETAESGLVLRTFRLTDRNGRRAPFYLLPGLDVEISASAIRAQVTGQVPPRAMCCP